MPHKFDPAWKEHLDDSQRRQLDPETVLDNIPLRGDEGVADIGCGTGFFTIPLARRLPGGKVLALDISLEMLASLREKVEMKKVGNVEAKLCGELDFPLKEESLDGVLLFFVLHETADRQAFLRRVAALVKPGGWIAMLEWRKVTGGPPGPPLEVRIDLSQTRCLAAKLSLSVTREISLGAYCYMLLLEK